MAGGYGKIMGYQKDFMNLSQGVGNQFGNLANQASYLTGQELTPLEQQQLALIGAGRSTAEQGISQNVREDAAARGLLSSAGAIGQEAAGLAQLDVQEAMAKSNLYGNAQNRQFQGYGLMSNLYGGQLGAYGQGANIAGQMMGTNQAQQQYQQQQQQNQFNNVLGIASLVAAPFTGGASMGAFGWQDWTKGATK